MSPLGLSLPSADDAFVGQFVLGEGAGGSDEITDAEIYTYSNQLRATELQRYATELTVL